MTTLKTPRLCTRKGIHTCRRGSVHVNEKDKEVLEQHNQATINLLCELLEGEIEALEHNEYCSLKEVPKEVASCGCWHQKEETLHKAQALIRQTLDPISSNER